MHALIDCDIFCYEMGHAKGEDGLPLEWNLVEWRLEERIDGILESTKATSWEGFLTGKGNFRDRIATILPYKGNRERSERPFWYQQIYNYLRDKPNVYVVNGAEADDAIADLSHERSTVIASRDKDFDQCEGWRHRWQSYNQPPRTYYINPVDGQRHLHYQLLVGDDVDNILGLYGVGPKSVVVKHLLQLDEPGDMEELVLQEYSKRFGKYAHQFFEENKRLLRLGDCEWSVA